MKPPARRRLILGLAIVLIGISVACMVLVLLRAYDRAQMYAWVGQTDLEVEFVVTDAGSGNPIPGARVEVKSEGGLYAERDKQEFALVADADGKARKVCRDSMCFGKVSGLRFTDTYSVHLPYWRFRVVAPTTSRPSGLT